ncbi:MAG TPA: hypothetical protein VF158_02515 [Longimicrobiales bacterium]
MPYNVLLLPLLGGYVFITYWNHTRFDAKRYTGERLLFHAALAGLLFLAVAYVITYTAAATFPRLAAAWKEAVPFAYSGTSLLAFFLGATMWWPLNRLLNRKEREAEKAVEQWGDFLEILFTRAIQETRQISLSLLRQSLHRLRDQRDRPRFRAAIHPPATNSQWLPSQRDS